MSKTVEKKFFTHTMAGGLCFLFLLVVAFPSFANSNVYSDKYAAYVMDAYTGTVLYKDREDKRLHPASLTKLMTLLLVFEALEQGKIKLYDRVLITSHAASMVPSKLDLPAGSTIKVKDAIIALTVKSANDVAVALAEKLGGSELNFARMMTNKARELGMRRTRFVNASGLHHPRQISTARDMAVLAQVLLTDYSQYYSYFSKPSFTYRGKTYKSHNKLLKSYAGMDGFKTGYIRASGFNLVSSAERDGTRLIGVVFGGKTGDLRNAQMAKILDRSFDRAGSIMMARVPVPERKPDVNSYQVASLDVSDMEPAVGYAGFPVEDVRLSALRNGSRWDMLDDNSMFTRLIGEGDYDMAVRKRLETGLIAVSAHLNEDIPSSVWATMETAASQPVSVAAKGAWAIQVGAFSSRKNTERVLVDSVKALPHDLQYAQSMIAPLQTQEGWIFRGRLHGYTKGAARRACQALGDCIPIAPHALHR